MICKINNKYYKFGFPLFLYLFVRPMLLRKKIDEPEVKAGMSSEFVAASTYIIGLGGLLLVAAAIGQQYSWTIPFSILSIIIAVIYGFYRGLVYIIKWVNDSVNSKKRWLRKTYRQIASFKIVFYKIGNRWL